MLIETRDLTRHYPSGDGVVAGAKQRLHADELSWFSSGDEQLVIDTTTGEALATRWVAAE